MTLNIEKLKEARDDELINSMICPNCLREENKIVRLKPAGGCLECKECEFSVCE